MNPVNSMPRNILILRPGALGDVIATRAPLACLRPAAPGCRLTLLASGSRGRLLRGPGLADTVFDLDRAEAAWLFSDAGSAPPPGLQAATGACRIGIAYLRDPRNIVRRNLRALGCETVVMHPARPDERGNLHIHEHLCAAVTLAFDRQTATTGADHSPEIDLRKVMRAVLGALPAIQPDPVLVSRLLASLDLMPGGYAVIHPGSGSPRKNWPVENFSLLARDLSRRMPVVVTAGEADNDLGREVTAGSNNTAGSNLRLCEHLALDELAALLSGARLYVGNDSGVSHLAAAVGPEPAARSCIVIFGPTSPAVWGPPGSRVITAPGGDPAALDFTTVLEACLEELER